MDVKESPKAQLSFIFGVDESSIVLTSIDQGKAGLKNKIELIFF